MLTRQRLALKLQGTRRSLLVHHFLKDCHIRNLPSRTSPANAIAAMSNPPHSTQSKETLVQDSIVWALQHGLVYGLGGDSPEGVVVHAPFTVFPTPYPREPFERAVDSMTSFSTLVDRVANDEEYLQSTLKAAAEFDDFTARLLQLLDETRPERHTRAKDDIVLGIHRSDYMLDQPTGRLLQVELNTIAASFGCLSTLVARMHRYLLSKAPQADMPLSSLPANRALEGIAEAIAAAVSAYGVPGAVAVMVVQPNERNAFDQQWIATQLWEAHGVRMVRRTLRELAEGASTSPEGHLVVSGQVAAVAYLRAGYSPNDYPSDVEWQGRALLECSRVVKCPTVAYQLAGAKKVQQDLAGPGVLERFVTPGEAAQLRQLFAGLWGLDDLSDPATAAIVAEAISRPQGFVLKPQREGGGNNYYGEELAARLKEGSGLSAFILMERIRPPSQRSVMVRNGVPREDDTLSELGIYGTFLRRGSEVILNKQIGHLVRTKTSSSNEGGVAAGYAVLDSPYMV